MAFLILNNERLELQKDKILDKMSHMNELFGVFFTSNIRLLFSACQFVSLGHFSSF